MIPNESGCEVINSCENRKLMPIPLCVCFSFSITAQFSEIESNRAVGQHFSLLTHADCAHPAQSKCISRSEPTTLLSFRVISSPSFGERLVNFLPLHEAECQFFAVFHSRKQGAVLCKTNGYCERVKGGDKKKTLQWLLFCLAFFYQVICCEENRKRDMQKMWAVDGLCTGTVKRLRRIIWLQCNITSQSKQQIGWSEFSFMPKNRQKSTKVPQWVNLTSLLLFARERNFFAATQFLSFHAFN